MPGSGNYAGNVLREAGAWLRDRPQQADALLAVVLLALSAGQLTAGPAGAASRVAFIVVTVLLAATGYRRRGITLPASTTVTTTKAARSAALA